MNRIIKLAGLTSAGAGGLFWMMSSLSVPGIAATVVAAVVTIVVVMVAGHWVIDRQERTERVVLLVEAWRRQTTDVGTLRPPTEPPQRASGGPTRWWRRS